MLQSQLQLFSTVKSFIANVLKCKPRLKNRMYINAYAFHMCNILLFCVVFVFALHMYSSYCSVCVIAVKDESIKFVKFGKPVQYLVWQHKVWPMLSKNIRLE